MENAYGRPPNDSSDLSRPELNMYGTSRQEITASNGFSLGSQPGEWTCFSRHLCPILQDHPVYFIENELAKPFLQCNGLRVLFCKVTDDHNIFIV